MKSKHWVTGQSLQSHRKSMLHFVWGILGLLLVCSYLFPVFGDIPVLIPTSGYFLILIYLISCFLISLWPTTAKAAPHAMMIGMTTLYLYLCVVNLGINSPVSHFLPLVPALASLLMRSVYCLIYGALVSVSITAVLMLDINGQLRDVTANDIQNCATLILTTIVVTSGCYFASVYDEKLVKSIRGKAGFDQLTNLPNRYHLIQRYNELIEEATQSDQKVVVVNFGVDDFLNFNKTRGSENADSLLISVSHVLASVTDPQRKITLARNKGNSFTLVFSDHSTDYGKEIIESAQRALGALGISDSNGDLVSVSAIVLLLDAKTAPINAHDALEKAHYYLAMTQSVGKRQVEVFEN